MYFGINWGATILRCSQTFAECLARAMGDSEVRRVQGFRLERIILFGFTRARISIRTRGKVLGLLRDDWRRSRIDSRVNGIKVKGEKQEEVIFSYLYVRET